MSERKIKVWVAMNGPEPFLSMTSETRARCEQAIAEAGLPCPEVVTPTRATLVIPAPKKRKVATKPGNRGGAKRARINKLRPVERRT